MKNIVVLSGAGISAESGLNTFRDANGLWENHDINQVASIQGWHENPSLVLDFYNKRRTDAALANPNLAHLSITRLEEYFNVVIVTQNVDDLHERALSKKIVHLHGQLCKARSIKNGSHIIEIGSSEIKLGDLAPDGHQLRPHIVWFGEEVPMMDLAINYIEKADIVIIVGTSLQVYPAAGLINYINDDANVFVVDKNDVPINTHLNIKYFKATAVKAMPILVDKLIKEYV